MASGEIINVHIKAMTLLWLQRFRENIPLSRVGDVQCLSSQLSLFILLYNTYKYAMSEI